MFLLYDPLEGTAADLAFPGLPGDPSGHTAEEAGKTIVLNNIFYGCDKAALRQESMSELDRLVQLLNENPGIRIELSSHTDNKGTNEYNQKLSQARAQSVVDFLISKGLKAERLVAKGYGETVPVASNETDEGRQQNRRTEFKILSK